MRASADQPYRLHYLKVLPRLKEASYRDPDHVKTWVGLVDGNKQQIAAMEEGAKKEGVELFILVDIIHVLEYL